MGLMANIADRVRAAFSTSVSGNQSVLPELHAFLQAGRIGGAITPAMLSTLILNADGGKIRALIDLGNEARQKDGHLQSVMFTRETSLNTIPWTIRPAVKPGKVEPLGRDLKIARWVEEKIRGIDPGPRAHGLQDLIAHLNGATFYSFAVAETNWTKDHEGKIVPKEFKLTQHRRFEFDVQNGNLLWRDPFMAEGVDLQKEYPGKFLIHQPRVNGDVPMREGLLRVMLWLALFRSWTVGDWMKLAELAWKPWRRAMYKKGSGKENREAAEAVLRALGSSGIAAYSDNMTVEVDFPEGGGVSSNHSVLAEFLAGEMSKAALGQTLTTEAGSRGARSLGEVHNEVRKDLMTADARAVAATIMRDLIAWMVYANFGDVPLPVFEFQTEDRQELSSFATALCVLVEHGLKIPVKWVREEAGIPEPDIGEEIMVPVNLSKLGSLAIRLDDDDPPPGTEPPDPAEPPAPPPAPEPPEPDEDDEDEDGEGVKEAA